MIVSKRYLLETTFYFFKWQGLHQKNAAENIEYIKEPKVQIPKGVMTRKELEKLFKQADTQSVLEYRDRVCMELLYGMGLRRREVTSLNVEDTNLKDQLKAVAKAYAKEWLLADRYQTARLVFRTRFYLAKSQLK